MEDNSVSSNGNNKRVRDDSDESPESKRLRANLLDFLDDSDAPGDRNPALASVIRSFEEEIHSLVDNDTLPAPLPSLEFESFESSLPDLGYLLEASDDDLGLPPTISGSDENDKEGDSDIFHVSPNLIGFDQMFWGFEDEIPSYDALEFGIPEDGNGNEDTFVLFEGLFGPSESLPAI
ncbi:uncharacterized protein LOC143846344 [Tasmannia lanceolata]|uniref:uncharacterized protein LOC143846344 n=1 Tax=Tasmannia lanceolata TaxID=3420 RepID=UPI0040629C5B